MVVLGIVGPPAGGKSTVAAMLAELGSAWVNADKLAHAAMRLPDVKRKFAQRFGDRVFSGDGSVDRKSLAGLVFGSDPTHRERLQYIESVIHPVVTELAVRRVKASARLMHHKAVVLDAPLLIEADWHLMCDEVWFVATCWEQQLARGKRRGWSEAELRSRQENQMKLDEKQRYASRTITNDSTMDSLRRQVEIAFQELLSRGVDARQHC